MKSYNQTSSSQITHCLHSLLFALACQDLHYASDLKKKKEENPPPSKKKLPTTTATNKQNKKQQ